MKAIDFVLNSGRALTRNEARRIIIQGGLKVNGKTVIVQEHESVNDVEISEKDVVEIGRKMVVLENWRYNVEMGGGTDAWKLNGEAYGHPNYEEGHRVWTSTPINFDPNSRILITASGRRYRLGVCAGNEREQIEYIMNDIANKGTEHW